jgi:alanyl-tRNA synthetase
VHELSSSLKVPREDLVERISELTASLKAAQKRVADFESANLKDLVPGILAQLNDAGPIGTILSEVSVARVDDLRDLAVAVRDNVQNRACVISLASVIDGKPSIIVLTTASAREVGLKAGALVKAAAGILGGGGGGRDDMAQAGGSDVTRLPEAFAAIAHEITQS